MDDTAHDTLSVERGLLLGSYRGLLALYSLTPLTTSIAFLLLALLPSLAYPLQPDQWKVHYPPYLPFPLPELLIAIAFSSLSYLLRTPIFSLASLLPSIGLHIFEETGYASYFTAFLSCAIHTVSALFLRVCTFAILLPSISHSSVISTRNPAFRTVWWTALGWSIAAATISITQGYQSIGLYRDVFVSFDGNSKARCPSPPPRDNNMSGRNNGKGKQVALPSDDIPVLRHEPNASYGTLFKDQAAPRQAPSSTDLEHQEDRRPLLRKRSDLSAISSLSFASLSLYPSITWDSPAEERNPGSEESELQIQVDRDIDHLLAFRRREELEELYGMPFIKIPVFVSCLHRVNSLLQSLGFSLLLAAGYFFTYPVRDEPASARPIRILTISVFVIHLCLTLLHSPILLPKLGVPTVVYVSFITALGTLFVGLAVWGGVS